MFPIQRRGRLRRGDFLQKLNILIDNHRTFREQILSAIRTAIVDGEFHEIFLRA